VRGWVRGSKVRKIIERREQKGKGGWGGGAGGDEGYLNAPRDLETSSL
jgi:hypothetical protein